MNARIEAGTAVLAQQGVEMASTNGTATTGHGPTITVADLLRTAERLGAMPKGKWMLVSPDGRVWADEEIGAIARAAALEALRSMPPFSFNETTLIAGIPGTVDEHGGNSDER